MRDNTRRPSGAAVKAKRSQVDASEGARLNTEEQAPAPKRQRVSRACDSCRFKKDKCDGAQPVCSTCASLGRPCTYNSNPKKRGVPTGYIRALELLLGLVFSKVPGGEETILSLLKAANLPQRLSMTIKDPDESDVFYSSWKNSSVMKEVDRTLMALEQPGYEQNKRYNTSPGDAEAILATDFLEWHLPDGIWDTVEASSFISPANPPSSAPTVKNTTPYTTRDCGTQTLHPVDTVDEMAPPSAAAPPEAPELQPRENVHRLHLQLPATPGPVLEIRISHDALNDNVVAQSSRPRTEVPLSVEANPSGPSNSQTRMMFNNGRASMLPQTPTGPGSSSAPRQSGASLQNFQSGNRTSGQPRHGASNNETTVLPELSTSRQATTAQYPPAYNDPGIAFDPFATVDGYHRQRIAPDLDALFDGLVSLDGTER